MRAWHDRAEQDPGIVQFYSLTIHTEDTIRTILITFIHKNLCFELFLVSSHKQKGILC